MGSPWIDYLFKVAVFLSAAYLFYHYLLRDDISFLGNRLYLMSMLPLSFLLPLIPLNSPFRSLTVFPTVSTDIPDIPIAASSSPSLFFSIVTSLYWAGVGLFILRILFHLFHLYRLQNRHPREQMQNITLVRIESPIPPFSFFNHIFLHTPPNCDFREIEQIISHESVHIRQFHSLDILIMELVVALQWFNPVVWFYRKALKETHEYLADREVIAQGFSAEGYRLLLFEQQFGARLYEFASHLKQSQIKRRMFMMNRMKTTGKAPYKIFLALPLIALLALALAEPRLVMATVSTDETKAQDEKAVTQKQPSKEEILDTLKKFETKEKFLKEKMATAENDDQKMKYKQALDELFKERQVYAKSVGIEKKIKHREEMSEQELKALLDKYDAKVKYLKDLYGKTDDPEKKEKIKQDITSIKKEREALMTDAKTSVKTEPPTRDELEKKLQMIQEKRKKLKQMAAEEKDEKKREELKKKVKSLYQYEEELKVKIESIEKKTP